MNKVLVLVILIFGFGCSDDATEPSESTIVGEWMRQINSEHDDDIDVLVLEFKMNGEFFAIGVSKDLKYDTLNGSYTYRNNIISLTTEKCEDEIGKYEYDFKNNGINLKLIEDECDRNEYIPEFYDKYKENLYND